MLRSFVEYPESSARGTRATIIVAFPRLLVPIIWARLAERSPIASPINSSGVVTSTFMIGSKRQRSAFLQASWRAIDPAIWKATSEESTSWKEPS